MDIVQLNMFDGKVCTKCGEWKPITMFRKGKGYKDGIRPMCNKCLQPWNSSKKRKAQKEENQQARISRLNATTKYCHGCQQTLPKYDFGSHKSTWDGLQAYCKICRRNRYNKDKVEISKKSHQRYWSNPEKARADKKRDHEKHSDERNKKRREYRNAHIDRERQRTREWFKSNPDRVRKISKITQHRRRARLRGNGGKYTQIEWDLMCNWFGNVCLCCQATSNLTVDHVIPIRHGGNNSIDNLQPLCITCNQSKWARHIDYRDPQQLAAFLEHIRELAHR